MYLFYKKYFLLNLKDYSSFGFDFPIIAVLFCFFIALIFTTIVVNIKRKKIEEIISALTRHKAFDEENAKTLADLRLDRKSLKHLLSHSDQLTKIVGYVGEKKLSYEEFMELSKNKNYKDEHIDFDSARFYIREEGRERAKQILDVGTSSTVSTILFCLLLVAIFICITFLMPGILSALNSLLGG